MKYIQLIVVLFLPVIVSACSGGNGNPVAPSDNSNDMTSVTNEEFKTTIASDVLYTGSSRETAYKAFGIFQVTVDPQSLTAEIVPSRKAQAIGMTFDSDLTQFLTVSPCANCLQVDGIKLIPLDQVEVGFSVKHPFADITKRPDLHGFDVRGIVLAKGNYNFPLTQVAIDESTNAIARANVSLVANPDGYTHHFDELAADPNYFDPPRNYDANINPFRSYFVDGGTPAFSPLNPDGHNVMAVGADWETQKYIFNLSGSVDPIDFAFVVDCAYGQSATFQNRTNPYYFLPEFNRKEAWSVVVNDVGGRFESGNTSSSMDYRVSACDWQSDLDADPNYPDTSNLGGIKAKSQIQKVTIEIPSVTGLVEKTTPDSGEGFIWNPYIFNITVTKSLGASAGWYYGIAAVRDDLQGMQGPIAIPETPAGFPYPGPEIYDYSTYQIFKVRVYGDVPNVTGSTYNSNPFEGDLVSFDVTIEELDGDTVTYQWEQYSPLTPIGFFEDSNVLDTVWQAPPLYDVSPSGVAFELRLIMKDDDGQTATVFPLQVKEKNSAPVCSGIVTDPYYGVKTGYDTMSLQAYGYDPDGDMIEYEWDMDWDGNPLNFNVDETGSYIPTYGWPDQGFYNVACKLKESRVNWLDTICSRNIIQEGIAYHSIKVDNSDVDEAGYFLHDVCMVRSGMGKPVYHVAWVTNNDNGGVFYANNAQDPRAFGNHQVLSSGPSLGGTVYAKVAGQGPIIHVIWIENDSSVAPTEFKVKINSSIDGGYSFDALGGERTVLVASEPSVIATADICAGAELGKFAIVFSDRVSGIYRCCCLLSDDGGLTWHYPVSGGFFRDVVSSEYAGDFTLEISASGIMHVLWQDYRTSTSNYYYDYSLDNGETWNADIKVNGSSNPSNGSMAIDYNNNGYFAWTDTNGQAYFAKTSFGSPPSLSGSNNYFNAGAGNVRATDIYVSPGGETFIIPVIYYSTDHYETRYFYSFNSGWYIHNYFTRIYDPSILINDIVCDGRWEINPNRMEIFAAWVDTRTSLAPLNDHLWGEFVYLAERF